MLHIAGRWWLVGSAWAGREDDAVDDLELQETLENTGDSKKCVVHIEIIFLSEKQLSMFTYIHAIFV